MPLRRQLTCEQREVVSAPDQRLMIEAHPGSGKTTVAAERFGHLRFAVPRDHRRCLALSFTRSATSELRTRIRRRWGGHALSYPHTAVTLDQFLLEVLQGLIRSGDVQWPEGHTSLDAHDSWVGEGATYISEHRWRAYADMIDRTVVVSSFRHSGRPVMDIGRVGHLREHHAHGRCTHDDVRNVLIRALQDDELTALMGAQVAARTRAIVVDEVFDGNSVDIGVLRVAADAGVALTVVGDPWQAVYGFRGADPWDSQVRLARAGFEQTPITGSFRFSREMGETARTLRARGGVELGEGQATACDIVLATEWRLLWGHRDVLPRSTGQVRNQWDAAHLTLLDATIHARTGESAVFHDEAHRFLCNDTVSPEELLDAAQVWLDASDPSLPGGELQASWRQALRDAGVTAQLRRPNQDRVAEVEHRMVQIVSLHRNRDATQGMTVHQAKGGEWDLVGVVLSPEQVEILRRGLDPTQEEHRVLYVGITRARERAVCVARE